jgi:hypothetical protein
MGTNQLTTQLDRLEESVKSLWQIISNFGSWEDNLEVRKSIHERLCRFNSTHSEETERISEVMKALICGYNLLESALKWKEPKVGNASDKVTETDVFRGIQWKLVIAHGGLETIIKTLMNDETRGLDKSTIEAFTKKCNLPVYSTLPSPKGDYKYDIWLNKPVKQGEPNAIISFLGLSRGDAKIIESWIVNSIGIDSWDKSIRLSKALRNATAHGALSATKVKQWDLVDKIQILTKDLGEIGIAGLNKFVE